MKLFRQIRLFRVFCFAVGIAAGVAQAQQLPEPLIFQIKHLVSAYGDAYAVEDVEGRMIQRLSPGPDGERVLAVFTVKGFRTGPRYRQYLALFIEGATDGEEKHYRLVDAIVVGGRGWRDVPNLDTKVTQGTKPGDLAIALQVLLNANPADPNALRRMETVKLQLKDGRFVELAAPSKAATPSAKKTAAPPKR